MPCQGIFLALIMVFTGLRVRKQSIFPSSISCSSNSEKIRATIECISAMVRDCPIQCCFPAAKGINPSSVSFVGLSHREGTKESVSSKILLFRGKSISERIAIDPLGKNRPPSVTKSLPRVRSDPPAAIGYSLILSFTIFLKTSDCPHSFLSWELRESRKSFCSFGCLASSLKIQD